MPLTYSLAAVLILSPLGVLGDPCACSGDNSAIPASQGKYKGTDYGKWCNAWDATYNYCSAENQEEKPDRKCWCPAQWCYVSDECASAQKSMFSEEVAMFFSFGTCSADPEATQCWDDAEGVQTSDYEDADRVTFGTRTRRATDVKVMDLGPAETQDWTHCAITSCMWFGGVSDGGPSLAGSSKIKMAQAKLTSTHGNNKADRAISGDYLTWFSDGSCLHSGSGLGETWSAKFVGLEGKIGVHHTVTEVHIYERRDCCYDRVNNLKIMIGNDVCVAKTSGGGKHQNVFKCEGTPTGNNIRIIRESGTEPMNFCEVEVFGNMNDSDANEEVSLGCKLVVDEHDQGHNYFKVETQPLTVAMVECWKGQAFKEIQWISEGKKKRRQGGR